MDPAILASLNQIHSCNLREREGALRSLINKTLQESARREVLSDMGTTTFVELLHSDSDVILMLSAWLLSHIAIDDKNCGVLLKTGVLQHIVPLLSSENTDVIEKTLWVVNNLLTSGIREQFIGKFSIISSLINLLKSSSAHIIFTATETLKNLTRKDSCQDYEENQKMFCDQMGLHVLSHQLIPIFPALPHKALLGIISLANVFTLYKPAYRVQFAECGIITSLVSMIANPSTSPDIREHALRLLYNISLEEPALKYLVENSALSALVSFILSTDEVKSNPNVLGLSILILANGVVDDELRASLRQIRDFGSALYKLGTNIADRPQISHDDSQAFIEVVANASCDDIVRYQLQSSTDVRQVVEKIVSVAKNQQINQTAAAALVNLEIPVEQAQIESHEQGMTRDESIQSVMAMKIEKKSNSKLFRNLDDKTYVRDSLLQKIFTELFLSEQSYVYNVGVLVRAFLARFTESAVVPTSLIYQLHKDLLKKMGQQFRDSSTATCLGATFVDFWANTRAVEEYRTFITNFDQAQAFFHELCNKMTPLKKLLNELLHNKETQGLSLFSFMIQPIQRIPRYILLLEDAVKQLPKNDPDYANLRAALVRTKQVADVLNEAKREAEKAAKIKEIHEKLVDIPKGFVLLGLQECLMDGLLVEDRLFGSRHIHMFLFPDMLMCTFPRRKQLKIEYIIKLRDLTGVIISQEKGTQQTVMHLRWKEKEERDLNLYLANLNAIEWSDAIQAAKIALK